MVGVVLILSIITGSTISVQSVWFWMSLGLTAITLYLYVTFRSFWESLRNDITNITSTVHELQRVNEIKAKSLSLSLLDLQQLSKAINAIVEQATKDISELKRLEQVRSEFLGNVSHELRTPIFSIQGYLETLIDGAIDDPEVRDEFVEKAHNNLLRLHTLLNDLIEISRIESGAMKMSFRYFDLYGLASEIVANAESTANMANVTINLELEGKKKDGKILVLADRKRIEQVLINLVDNAIKYNRPEGNVSLIIEASVSNVQISVNDTGIGIPSEQIDRVFERFYRVDKGRSRSVGGTGLGLAIVKHIIEAHGSQITVQSDPERGTSFSFTLERDK